MFIFARCLRSSAAATPVKYECDIMNVTCVLIILKNRVNNGTEKIGLVTPTPELQPPTSHNPLPHPTHSQTEPWTPHYTMRHATGWPLLGLLSWYLVIVRRAGLLWSQQDFEWRWSVPLFKCLTVLEFSLILFDLCLLITFFNFIMNYVPIVTFWIFTYHKIWILSIMFCSIWSYWIIYFLACLEVSWRVVS